MSDYLLLTPGPVAVPKEALQEFGAMPIHHRTPEFDKILLETREALKQLFQVTRPVHIISSTGSGSMEAAVCNFLSPNEKAIVIVSGKFGERWAEMLETYGVRCLRLNLDWGKNLSLSELENLLTKNPDCKAVYCQMCETSTGALHPVETIAKLVKKCIPDCLFMLDAITGILTQDLKIEDSQIDVVVAGSQKAFMLPTGISFLYMSELAEKKCQEASLPRFYFDLRKELKAYANGQTYYSSPVSHIRALNACAKIILTKGLKSHFAQIQRLAKATRSAIESIGLKQFPESPAPALSVILLPDNIDGKKFRNHLEEKYKVVSMGGQDQLTGKVIRIGHIGDLNFDEVAKGMECFGKCLIDFGYPVDLHKMKEAFYQV